METKIRKLEIVKMMNDKKVGIYERGQRWNFLFVKSEKLNKVVLSVKKMRIEPIIHTIKREQY